MGHTVSIVTPAKWTCRHFWWWGQRRALGVVIAFSPRALMFGVEAIIGEAKGVAIQIGPFWLGFATLMNKEPTQ